VIAPTTAGLDAQWRLKAVSVILGIFVIVWIFFMFSFGDSVIETLTAISAFLLCLVIFIVWVFYNPVIRRPKTADGTDPSLSRMGPLDKPDDVHPMTVYSPKTDDGAWARTRDGLKSILSFGKSQSESNFDPTDYGGEESFDGQGHHVSFLELKSLDDVRSSELPTGHSPAYEDPPDIFSVDFQDTSVDVCDAEESVGPEPIFPEFGESQPGDFEACSNPFTFSALVAEEPRMEWTGEALWVQSPPNQPPAYTEGELKVWMASAILYDSVDEARVLGELSLGTLNISTARSDVDSEALDVGDLNASEEPEAFPPPYVSASDGAGDIPSDLLFALSEGPKGREAAGLEEPTEETLDVFRVVTSDAELAGHIHGGHIATDEELEQSFMATQTLSSLPSYEEPSAPKTKEEEEELARIKAERSRVHGTAWGDDAQDRQDYIEPVFRSDAEISNPFADTSTPLKAKFSSLDLTSSVDGVRVPELETPPGVHHHSIVDGTDLNPFSPFPRLRGTESHIDTECFDDKSNGKAKEEIVYADVSLKPQTDGGFVHRSEEPIEYAVIQPFTTRLDATLDQEDDSDEFDMYDDPDDQESSHMAEDAF
jgi:hypothetical protein